MAFDNQSTKTEFAGNGVTTQFAIDFYYTETDTSVLFAAQYNNVDPLAPVEVALVKDVDYTIDETAYPNTEFNFAIAPPTDHVVYLYREHDSGQATTYLGLQFPPETTEETFDTLAMQIQELRNIMYNVGLNQSYLDSGDQLSDFYQFLNSQAFFRKPLQVIAADSILAVSNTLYLLNTADAVDINMPPSPPAGVQIAVKDIRGTDLANKTIDANGGTFPELGTDNFALTSAYQTINFVSDDSGNWYII